MKYHEMSLSGLMNQPGVKKAREITEKAALETTTMNIEFEERLDNEIRSIINKKIKEAEKDASVLEKSFISECDQIKEKASLNIDKAVEFVIEKVGSGRWQ